MQRPRGWVLPGMCDDDKEASAAGQHERGHRGGSEGRDQGQIVQHLVHHWKDLGFSPGWMGAVGDPEQRRAWAARF